MRVLIVENEIYLAQSIASKLADIGYSCEIATNTKDALKGERFDIVLLSTTLAGQDFYPVIEKFRESIIILLVSYISNDTVSNPVKAGAKDYLQKPFIIEELIRKIKLFENYRRIDILNSTYESLLEGFFKNYEIPKFDFKKIKPPFFITTSSYQYASHFAFCFAKFSQKPYVELSLLQANLDEILHKNDEILHLYDFGLIGEEARDLVLNSMQNKNIIISSNLDFEASGYEKITINHGQINFRANEILTIDEYIKQVISCYQDNFKDTELSKKLGISRKSLWEKRKKYGITKKK